MDSFEEEKVIVEEEEEEEVIVEKEEEEEEKYDTTQLQNALVTFLDSERETLQSRVRGFLYQIRSAKPKTTKVTTTSNTTPSTTKKMHAHVLRTQREEDEASFLAQITKIRNTSIRNAEDEFETRNRLSRESREKELRHAEQAYVLFERGVRECHFFMFLSCNSNHEKITRIAHAYHEKLTRKSTLECTLDCDVNSNTNTGTDFYIAEKLPRNFNIVRQVWVKTWRIEWTS